MKKGDRVRVKALVTFEYPFDWGGNLNYPLKYENVHCCPDGLSGLHSQNTKCMVHREVDLLAIVIGKTKRAIGDLVVPENEDEQAYLIPTEWIPIIVVERDYGGLNYYKPEYALEQDIELI